MNSISNNSKSKSKSIEAKDKKNNNIYNKINININKKNIIAPWKLKDNKLDILKSSEKNKVNKMNVIDRTPKRSSLFYNNINIKTINVNENRMNKLKLVHLSEKRTSKKEENNTNSNNYKKDYNRKKNIFNKINFSKLIDKTKNKHNIYLFEPKNNLKTIGKSLEPYHNIIKKGLFIKSKNIQNNIINNNLPKNNNIITFYHKSEKNINKIKTFH